MLIPALIMGNTVVAKLPRHGSLALWALFPALQASFPAGTINAFFGRGAETVAPIIQSGKLSSLAFIGGSTAANMLRVQHPKPSRMRCILGLDAKNAAIVLPDANLDLTVKELLLGTLSFAGQRCTAIKITFVHSSIAEQLVERLSAAVDSIRFGLPWDTTDVVIGPLAEYNKPQAMQAYVDDAIAHGARVTNANGGLVSGTFYFPSVVYPVTSNMVSTTQRRHKRERERERERES
jgi:glyceraldehyde-3-phosphate dehydrogenase (NADP+)